MEKGRNKGIILAGLWMLTGYVLMVRYMWVNWAALINSDMSAEFLLARQLRENGGILSGSWYYSTELRVLNNQIVYKMALGVFPDNWRAARTLAVAVLLVLFLLAYLFLMWCAGCLKCGVWSAAVLVWPFSRWYAVNLLIGCYYIPHLAFSFLSVGLLLLFCRAKGAGRVRQGMLCAAMGLVAFGACLGGVRQLLVCYVPLAAACALAGLYAAAHKAPLTSFWRRWALGAAVLLGGGMAGYLVNTRVLAARYAFESYAGGEWGGLSLTRVWDRLSEFFSLFGYQEGRPVLSASGLASAFGVVLAGAVVYSAVSLFRRQAALSEMQRFFLWLFVGLLGVHVVVLCWTSYSYHVTYWIPLVPFALLLVEMQLATGPFAGRTGWQLAFVAALVAGITLCGRATLALPEQLVETSDATRAEAVAWLEENGYQQGFAGFWNSDVLTELSNGKIEVWTVQDTADLKVYEYLQDTGHETLPSPDTPVFYMLTAEEAGQENLPYPVADSPYLGFANEGYYVLAFPRAEILYDSFGVA